ncbi:hypothetical protein BCR39DRAFT_573992 [Naematelia encephala]|uniref:Uncharacterized protein n=1 Tax=Naematelia encephala TaxID=71784 RepID=A0A1Y2B6A7_9TREE|nr:hypothetical protein BCR39DRAFT_573992 [Naematelia encephala]
MSRIHAQFLANPGFYLRPMLRVVSVSNSISRLGGSVGFPSYETVGDNFTDAATRALSATWSFASNALQSFPTQALKSAQSYCTEALRTAITAAAQKAQSFITATADFRARTTATSFTTLAKATEPPFSSARKPTNTFTTATATRVRAAGPSTTGAPETADSFTTIAPRTEELLRTELFPTTTTPISMSRTSSTPSRNAKRKRRTPERQGYVPLSSDPPDLHTRPFSIYFKPSALPSTLKCRFESRKRDPGTSAGGSRYSRRLKKRNPQTESKLTGSRPGKSTNRLKSSEGHLGASKSTGGSKRSRRLTKRKPQTKRSFIGSRRDPSTNKSQLRKPKPKPKPSDPKSSFIGSRRRQSGVPTTLRKKRLPVYHRKNSHMSNYYSKKTFQYVLSKQEWTASGRDKLLDPWTAKRVKDVERSYDLHVRAAKKRHRKPGTVTRLWNSITTRRSER